MTVSDHIKQLEKWRTDQKIRQKTLEKFRYDTTTKYKMQYHFSFVRLFVCLTTATMLFISSLSPVFADPFQLKPPQEHLIPEDLLSSNRNVSSPIIQKKKEQMAQESVSTQKDISESSQQSNPLETKTHQSESSLMSSDNDDESVIHSQPNHKEKVVPKGTDSKLINTPTKIQTEDGGKLPHTASSSVSLILQGIATMLIGMGLWNRKKVHIVQT